MYINAYKCRAVGLTINEAKCLVFASSEPDEETMQNKFDSIPARLERYGMMELVTGVWSLTSLGISKLNACVPDLGLPRR